MGHGLARAPPTDGHWALIGHDGQCGSSASRYGGETPSRAACRGMQGDGTGVEALLIMSCLN